MLNTALVCAGKGGSRRHDADDDAADRKQELLEHSADPHPTPAGQVVSASSKPEKGRGPLQSVPAGCFYFNENAVNTRECNRVKGATQGAMLLKLHLRAWVQQAQK